MKIAFITIGFNPYRASGLDISGERLVNGFLQLGHQVTVIAAGKGTLEEVVQHPNLRIYRLPIGASNWIAWGWRAARQVSRLNRVEAFDVIHFWDVYFAWAYRGSFIGSLQHSFEQRLATSPEAGLVKKTYYALARQLAEIPSIRRAKGLLAGSASSLQAYLAHYDIPPAKTALVRHGIDTHFFQPRDGTKALREQLGVREDERVIIFSGFFTPRKGLIYLAEALRAMDPIPRLVLTGRWDASFRHNFFQAAGELGERVIEAGFVPDEMLPVYFSMADLYVSPSLLEGFGLPIAEALACETPAVGADAGSVAEVIGPGGVLVPPRDPAALAAAIAGLLKDPEARSRLGKQGREHIRQHFSVEGMVSAALDGYTKFIG